MGTNPHPCKCHGGFCWRQFCPEKQLAKIERAREAEAAPPPPREPRRRTLVWRWDGSHRAGPVPAGRLPQKP